MLKLRFAGPGAQAPDPLIERPTGVHVWLNRQGGVVARGFREAGFHWMAWPDLATYRFAPADPFITEENRRRGQLAWLLRAQTLVDVDCWTRVPGEPLRPGAIVDMIRRTISHRVGV